MNDEIFLDGCENKNFNTNRNELMRFFLTRDEENFTSRVSNFVIIKVPNQIFLKSIKLFFHTLLHTVFNLGPACLADVYAAKIVRLIRCYCYVLLDSQNSHIL